MTVTVSRTMGHVIEVNPPDLAAQPSMISLKCQIPRFGWNPDAVSTVSNLPQHASLLHQLPWYIFALAQRLGWMFQHLTGSQMSPAADKNPGGLFRTYTWFGKSLCCDLFFFQSISSARRSSYGISQDEGKLRYSTPHICDKDSMLNHQHTENKMDL